MPHRHHFRERRRAAAAGGTYDEVEFGPILEDRLYALRRVAAEDETTTLTGALRLYVKGHGYEHWLAEQKSPQLGTLYWLPKVTYLRMGESLVARFTGATASDVLQLYLEGVWWEITDWGQMNA